MCLLCNDTGVKISQLLILFILLGAGWTYGHGFAGSRFFPATLVTDDPFVADEVSLPTVSGVVTPEEGGTRETEISADIAKRITPDFGIEIGESLTNLRAPGEPSRTGFRNLQLGAKYEIFESDEHETILSLGAEVEIGGTGNRRVEADSFTTWAPAFFFGKGLGDLPDTVSFVRPFAVTGQVGIAIPTSASTRRVAINETTGERDIDIERHADVLAWGFAVEYSLIYLQEQVKNVGLHAPFDRLIPLVEFAFETPLNRNEQGLTTGTVNPGVVWSGKYFQLGAEAMVPINSRTGNDAGFIAQVHFYLDDLFPHSLGRPIFATK